MVADNPSTLSSKIEEILSRIPDPAFAGKLRKVYEAAGKAIQRLSALDLSRYEERAAEDSTGLALWEQMAPAIRDTVMDVNALLLVLREQFPAHPEGGLGDTLSRVLEETGPGTASASAHRAGEAEEALQRAGRRLAQQITQLGENMRTPQLVSDRWSLLKELQARRARFREEVGGMIYRSALVFAEVDREEVVPCFEEDVEAAVEVRSTVTDLIRLIAVRMESIHESDPEDVQWHAGQLEKELGSFQRTPAYRSLRAQDKKEIVEFRHALAKAAGRPSLPKRDLVRIADPFWAFVRSLAQVNNRELLLAHDRGLTAACGVKLERALLALGSAPAEAAAAFAEVLSDAQALYGRDAELDDFLRRARKLERGGPREAELKELIDRLVQLIAALPLHRVE